MFSRCESAESGSVQLSASRAFLFRTRKSATPRPVHCRFLRLCHYEKLFPWQHTFAVCSIIKGYSFMTRGSSSNNTILRRLRNTSLMKASQVCPRGTVVRHVQERRPSHPVKCISFCIKRKQKQPPPPKKKTQKNQAPGHSYCL